MFGRRYNLALLSATIFAFALPACASAAASADPVIRAANIGNGIVLHYYGFLTVINRSLAHLLPDNQSVVIHGAGHQMWYRRPELCRDLVETFLRWALPSHG